MQALRKVCVLDIDMQGVRSLKKTELNPLFVYVQPPSLEELVSQFNCVPTFVVGFCVYM